MNPLKLLLFAPAKSFDASAFAFIQAAGITNPQQAAAINTLTLELKAAGIWTKMDVIYPFVGGTAAQHSYNLKDPRAVAGAFYITWAGSVTHNSNGITGDGSTGYGDTLYAIPGANQNSFSMGVYCRNNVQGNFCAIGTTINNASAFTQMFLRQSGAGNALEAEINQSVMINTFNNTNSQGFYSGVRTASNVVVTYKNTTAVASDTDASVVPSTAPLNLLVRNATAPGTRGSFATYNLAFAYIGTGLTAQDVANYYAIVQTYQTNLSRQV